VLPNLTPSAQQRPPTFSATANLVVVPAVVVDGKGVPVIDLKIEQFQVTEDGRPMSIETFIPPEPIGAGTQGRFIVLVLDNLRTPPTLAGRVRDIAGKFADRMGPTDIVSVITISGGRSTSVTGAASVRAAIGRFRPALGGPTHSEADDVNHGLRTIRTLAEQMAQTSHRRKVLVFIGSASIFTPKEPSAFANLTNPELAGPASLSSLWFDAVRSTARENVSVYVIDPAGFTGDVDDYSQGFAEYSGGHAWVNAGNFNQAVDQIWRDSAAYYLLGYVAPSSGRGLRRIDVKVDRPGVVVRARRARG
jgi:VWFA-related protein